MWEHFILMKHWVEAIPSPLSALFCQKKGDMDLPLSDRGQIQTFFFNEAKMF